jgi:hypothetical protein
VEITYTNAGGDQVVHAQALLRERTSSFAFYHYFWVFYWGAMAALGVYVSLFVGQIFIACVFVSMFLLYAVVALPYSRVWQRWARRVSRGTARKHICLRLDEQGLHETVEGAVESFAPWSAVRSFAVFDGHLFVELAGDLWANVPRATVVEGDAAFEEIVRILRAHGVVEQPSNQAMQRTADPPYA